MIDQSHSIFAAQSEIGEKDVDVLAFEHIHRAGDVARDINVIIIFEHTPQPVTRVLLIIDNENGWLHQFHSMKFREKAG